MSNTPIKRVMTVGGTHGNELTGVYLVKKFQKYPHIIQRSTFETLTLLANPKAIEVGRRYLETDLNRCFKPQDLQNKNLFKYEQLRAKEIAQYIQDKQIDFIIDLHRTTANMGLTERVKIEISI
ncbi:Aspartoacylase [Gloeothece citriformis PCC 7424]|uniref:Aspartoacylase n=1 Tax=Gloeothece citriformis (strain PCC 7424) TaxID=65393 RepID=B7KJ66_GLOC7|nr:succinylglutamate desuccinylase/aspartoacylase family protein [Gloeothece citriformis]ACK72150.1 Aspartoacylase [Gloeothece citriformis PCC 7424]